MNRSTRMYNKNTNPFFSFTGKIFLKEKTCVEHYSYDVHGNVKTLIQDHAGISIPEQRYKKMEYEYDLISGKVNAVHYQNNQPDQFHHKYEYDADNRITDVYTSKDKILWDHDAKYFYYPHGPLARIEYGDNHVQGMDFAYTLQGWIKGTNSETLNETRDIGQDGNLLTGNPNAHFAKDAFGYSLTYFEGDYKSIGTSGFEANKQNSDLLKARNDLFNGNISAMVTTIVPPTVNGNTICYSPLPQGTAYKYDQLNRLIEMQAWQNMDAANNIWNSGLAYAGMYHNQFTYDGNGNIETQQRYDAGGNKMDDLVYNYLKTNGKKKHNRLYSVDDDVTLTNNFTEDIDDQNANNYAYDEIGNLITDEQEEIAMIRWTASGKVKELLRTMTSSKPNLSFEYDAQGNRIAKHVIATICSKDGIASSTYYTRDAQGNIMSIYKKENDPVTQTQSFVQIEKPIYGSTRIGTEKTKVELIGAPPIDATHAVRELGNKEFDGTNHLSNTLTIFTDRKIPIDINTDGMIDFYWPHVVGSMDYYPYGQAMRGRSFNSTVYRYGFNSGSEKDDEISGGGNHYTTEWRELDTRLGGRWWSVDPIIKPWESPYVGFANNPINYSDPLGLDPNKPISNPEQGDIDPNSGATYDNDLGWVLPEVEIKPDGGSNSNSGLTLEGITGTPDEIRKAPFIIQNNDNCPDCLDPSTIGNNLLWLTYPGGNNPISYNRQYNYSYIPNKLSEYPAIGHDRRYDKLGISGASGLFFDTRAIGADWRFVGEQMQITVNPYLDPVDRASAAILGIGLGISVFPKTIFHIVYIGPMWFRETMMWYNISNEDVSNAPTIHKHEQ